MSQREQSPREKALRSLEDGADAAVAVGRWVRSLAADEARGDSEFGRTLDLKPNAEQWGTFGREVFGSLYGLGTEEVPEAEAPKGAQWIRELLGQAESLPEWKALQARAATDAWASGLASAQALDALAPAVQPPQEDAQNLRDEAELMEQLMRERGRTSPKHLRKLAELKRRAREAEAQDAAAVKQIQQSVSHVRSKLRGAIQKASEALDEAQEALDGLGCGGGPGAKNRVASPRTEVLSAVRNDARLRRIAKLAGRLRAQAIQKQNTKAKHGREELCDVTVGSDLARLLPSETVFLADPDLEALLYRKLIENAALEYELRGLETKAEGPIVLVVDESGSMSGQNDEWAKAVALALMEVAARQKRVFAYVHFDDGVSRVDTFANPGSVSMPELLACVEHFTGGGTSIAAGLAEADRIIGQAKEHRDFKRADVVLITDGADYDRESQLRATRAFKAKGAALFNIGIGGAVPEWLQKEASASVVVHPGDMTGASGKLDEVFSV